MVSKDAQLSDCSLSDLCVCYYRCIKSLSRTSRNQEGNEFWGKKRFSAVRRNLDDPPIHIPQNVPALAGLNEITFARSSPYGVIIFSNL
jgi:hypothetical protein